MPKARPLLRLAALLLGGLLGMAAPAKTSLEAGFPRVRNYPPSVYGAGAQNWAVLQDARGIIYAGNNRGVLEFDGNHWSLIPTTRGTVVRSLGLGPDGRVYVGGVGEIGYLAPDAHGSDHFVSLVDRIPAPERTFSDVWVTRATPAGILFQSREYLFLLHGSRVRVVKADTTFHVAFVVGTRIFVRQRDVGLEELQGGRLALVPGGRRFAQRSVFVMLPLGTGGRGGILVGSRTGGLWRLGRRGLSPFRTPAAAYLRREALYGGTLLPDGSLALATIRGGVVLLDPEGRVLGLLDRRAGLMGDNVKYVCPDRDSGLWLALDNGLARVAWSSPRTVFDGRAGLQGTVWALQRFRGRLYAATGQGAFVLVPSDSGSDPWPRFQPLAGVDTQSLAFLPFGRHLLLASAQGIFSIRGAHARLVRPSSPVAISLLRPVEDPSLLLAGMQGGVLLLRHPPGSSRWLEAGGIAGVEDDIYSMVEDGRGRIWLGTGSRGIYRLTLPSGWWRHPEALRPAIAHYGLGRGLPSLGDTTLFMWRGELLAATQAGVLRYEEAGDRFAPEPRFSALFPGGPRAIKAVHVDTQDRVWMETERMPGQRMEAGVAVPREDGSLAWVAGPYRPLGRFAVDDIQVDGDGTVWFGGPAGIVRFDPARAQPEGCGALIRRVSTGKALLFGGTATPGRKAEKPVLSYRQGTLRFDFSSPEFAPGDDSGFQVRLDGYDPGWSAWTKDAFKEYTNLPEGRYRFRVRARNGEGGLSPEADFAFRILPPWYRTWWAFLLFLAAGGAAVGGLLRMRTRLLRRRNQVLQGLVAQATEDLRERERLLASQAGALERANARLRDLDEQKNQFLAVVAHDLRNPLNAIMLSSQVIEGADDLQEARRRAARITRECAGMDALIGRFLDLSALETGSIQTEPGEIAVACLADDILARHEPAASAKGISLVRPEGAEEARAFADPRFAAAVLDNLVSNAIKFSPRGATVRVAVAEREGMVRVSVQDQGPGLTEEDMKRLFGRFARLSAQPTGGEKSIGLGLSIARQMVEACGGRIWAESEPGHGATFQVELPRSGGRA